MATLKELMAQQSQESQERIAAKVEDLRIIVALNQLREELNISQTELAAAMGVKQPTVAKIEQPDNDPRLSTLKRYVTALGGEVSIDVILPTGMRVTFHIGFFLPGMRSAAGQKPHYFLRESLNAANRKTIHTGSRIAEVRMPSMVHISTRIIARKAIQR